MNLVRVREERIGREKRKIVELYITNYRRLLLVGGDVFFNSDMDMDMDRETKLLYNVVIRDFKSYFI